MRVSFILPGNGRYGGVRSTVVVANHLVSRGHDVRIFVRNCPQRSQRIREMWINLLYPGCCDWLDRFSGNLISYHDMTHCKFLPDEVIVGVGMWVSAQLTRIDSNSNPKLQNIRGATPWMPHVMKEALSSAIPKIAVSFSVSDVIKSYGGNVLAVIHNGISQQQYYPSVEESHRNGIGTIFSSHPAKDPRTVVQVLKKLRIDMPNVPHYIFGSSRRPKAIPARSYKRYPSVAEARNLYSRSMVWILGSSSEGLPNPVLEAMACGCAVVATDCGGTRDIVVDGENGFLVEIGNVDQIVGKVKLLLKDDKLRQRMVRKSRETVNRFSWNASVSKLETVLESLVSDQVLS